MVLTCVLLNLLQPVMIWEFCLQSQLCISPACEWAPSESLKKNLLCWINRQEAMFVLLNSTWHFPHKLAVKISFAFVCCFFGNHRGYYCFDTPSQVAAGELCSNPHGGFDSEFQAQSDHYHSVFACQRLAYKQYWKILEGMNAKIVLYAVCPHDVLFREHVAWCRNCKTWYLTPTVSESFRLCSVVKLFIAATKTAELCACVSFSNQQDNRSCQRTWSPK